MITDFLKAALPWVLMGITVIICAMSLVRKKKKQTKETEEQNTDGGPAQNYGSVGLCLGMALGILVGKYLYDNMTIGMCVGMCLGLAVGNCIEK